MYQYDIKPCCFLWCIVFCHRICVVICNVFSGFFWPAVCSTWRDEEIQAAIATLHQVFPGEIIPLSRTAWGIAAVALWVCMQRRKYLTRYCSNLTLCQFYSSKNKIINLRVFKRVCIFSSRTEGSISGSNSSLELYSVSRQPDVRRQKVVPTQKTCVISPPRHKENKQTISPRQHLVMSPRRLTETDQQGASKSESQEEVVCLDDEDSDVICIPDDHEKAYSPTGRSCPHS